MGLPSIDGGDYNRYTPLHELQLLAAGAQRRGLALPLIGLRGARDHHRRVAV